MPLDFAKLEAAGNDLIMVDARPRAIPDLSAWAVRLCDRHFGAGGDGLLSMHNGPDGLPLMLMHNPDGTEDFCGNGVRAGLAWLAAEGEAKQGRLVLATPCGRHAARIEETAPGTYRVAFDLVAPRFDPASVPTTLPGPRVIDRPFEIAGATYRISSIYVGTTHTVIYSDRDPSDEEFLRVSPLLENHEIFPRRTSVLWCRALDRARIRMRVWERGVGETFACGTGATAAVIVGFLLKHNDGRAEVITRGGTMTAEWRGEGPARLTGMARLVYRGHWVSN